MTSSTEQRTTEARTDSVREQVVVAVHDTIREVTTITVQLGAQGDTVFQSVVTDRERGRSRDAIAVQKTKVEVVRDTVYVERRDSVEVLSSRFQGSGTKDSWGNQLARVLKWIFWIAIGLSVLVLVVRFSFKW